MSVIENSASRAASASVRVAKADDSEALGETLARAFHDDPVMLHFLPKPEGRHAKLARIFKLLFKLGRPYGACYVTGNYEAATLWRPPEQWHVPFWQYIVNGPELLGIFGTNALNVMNTMDMVEKNHAKKPHWYLQVIGTDPAKQGKGFASLIMRDRLAAIDAAHMPAYLESSKDSNIPIYRNFGFEVTGEIKIPDGPTIWPMWREAR